LNYYYYIVRCWNTDSSVRPSIEEVISELEKISHSISQEAEKDKKTTKKTTEPHHSSGVVDFLKQPGDNNNKSENVVVI
jgi:hypothetical protein